LIWDKHRYAQYIFNIKFILWWTLARIETRRVDAWIFLYKLTPSTSEFYCSNRFHRFVVQKSEIKDLVKTGNICRYTTPSPQVSCWVRQQKQHGKMNSLLWMTNTITTIIRTTTSIITIIITRNRTSIIIRRMNRRTTSISRSSNNTSIIIIITSTTIRTRTVCRRRLSRCWWASCLCV